MLWHPTDHGMQQRPRWQRAVGRLFWHLVLPLATAFWFGFYLIEILAKIS